MEGKATSEERREPVATVEQSSLRQVAAAATLRAIRTRREDK